MRCKLRDLFTKQHHMRVLQTNACNEQAACVYNDWLQYSGLPQAGNVSRQLVRFWRKLYLSDKPTQAVAKMKEARKIKAPEMLGAGGVQGSPTDVYHRILVIPDLHAPYHHKDSLRFLKAVAAAFAPDFVINLGDETDKHAMSFHDSDPDLMAAGDELAAARKVLAMLEALFPHMKLCDSNHGSMHYRKAKHHGIPTAYLKDYRDILFPTGLGKGWEWAENWRLQTPMGEVMFKHQASGPILVDAAHNQCNLMVGHSHGNFSVEYTAGSKHLYWGAYSGCLIDKDSLAFAYGKHTLRKPVLGCSMIMDGRPVLIPMVLDRKGNWIGVL